MLTIHHLEHSRSERIVWLAEELGIPYQLQRYPRDADRRAGAAYRALHPHGRSPVVEEQGQWVMESGAICEWLGMRHGEGRLSPARDSADYARYLEWMHFAEGSAMAALLTELRVGMAAAPDTPPSPQLQGLRERNADMVRFIDSVLGERRYFAGADFSAADIMMEYVLGFVEQLRRQPFAGDHPHIARWLAEVRQRPAHARALALIGQA